MEGEAAGRLRFLMVVTVFCINSFARDFDDNLKYTFDDTILEDVDSAAVMRALKDKSVIAFYGSWCEDSQFLIPKLNSVMVMVKPERQNSYQLISVSRTKLDIEGHTDRLGIIKLPTIVVFDERGIELGRIVEKPKVDLISDLLYIAQSEIK